ncbi:MAG: lycopene cyclase domain-containing protein [Microbacterium sp.]|nr:lycopene cyclase domain-containing protein [Microbacterium sp.]
MTAYLWLAVPFLGLAVVAAVVLSSRLAAEDRPRPLAVLATVLTLFSLTAVFDSLMIAAGLFHYAPGLLLGVTVWLAPVEDFAYPLAGAVLLPALWALLRSRRSSRTASASRRSSPTASGREDGS